MVTMNFIYRLRKQLKKDIFSQQDLKDLLHSKSDAAINSAISRALKSGALISLKRGLFAFSKELQNSSISKLSIANKLYTPSYVSFETALSYYGLIPEAVYTTTSACLQRKNKVFKNELGVFTFDYIPCSPFFMGVASEEGILIATGLRALFDLIYTRRKTYSSIEELEEDLRVDQAILKQEVSRFSTKEIEVLARSYGTKNTYQFYLMLTRSFK